MAEPPLWWRVSGGRLVTTMAGMPVIELVTTGRRSGERRSVLLSCVVHPDGYVVVASNAGDARLPAWWHNLMARPETWVQYGRERCAVRARAAEPGESASLWAELDAVLARRATRGAGSAPTGSRRPRSPA